MLNDQGRICIELARDGAFRIEQSAYNGITSLFLIPAFFKSTCSKPQMDEYHNVAQYLSGTLSQDEIQWFTIRQGWLGMQIPGD